MQISVERDDPNKSSVVFYWLLMKYHWTHAVCLTDFSRNQLLCPKTLATFPLSGDFRSRARQPGYRSCKFHRWWLLNMQIHGMQNKFCRFCFLITQISFFVIPKVCLSKCVFRCLNTCLSRFSLKCGFIFPNTGFKPRAKTVWKKVQRKSKAFFLC